MGTLLGNDYADKKLFENIFSQIHLPKSKSMNDQHRKLQGLLEWLKGQTVEEAIDRVSLYLIFYFKISLFSPLFLDSYVCQENLSY